MTETTWEMLAEYADGSGEYAWLRCGDRVYLADPDDSITIWRIEQTDVLDLDDAPDPIDFKLTDRLSFAMGEDLFAFELPDETDIIAIDGITYLGYRFPIVDEHAKLQALDALDALSLDAEPAAEQVDPFGGFGAEGFARLVASGAIADEPAAAPASTLAYLNSVRGVVHTMKTIAEIREPLQAYEQDWISLDVVGLNAIRFVYSSEDSTDVVGMLDYLADLAHDATGFGGLIIERFAFGQDRLDV